VAVTVGAPSTSRIVAAFLAVYVIWGSTYLGIRVALESMPPYVMAGTRFFASAALMTLYAMSQRAPRPDSHDLRSGVLTGLLMLSAGNGTVTWASQYTASGRIALLVALTPVWMTLFDWARPNGVKPARLELVGLVVGFLGVVWLIGPDVLGGDHAPGVLGAELLVVMGSMSWGGGSLLTRYAKGRTTPAMRTALQMWVAGVVLTGVALVRGEWATFDSSTVTMRAWLAWGYLVTFGSLIGFTAYVWLLKVVAPSKAATYAYVNPAVALFLGWWLLDEPLSARTLAASAVIIGGVAAVTLARRPVPVPARADTDETPISEVA
jgi:drug/metabolite transporter (DMT)-like permease